MGLSKALGFYFIRQDIKRQDRIAIVLENGPEWPIFYFGILLAGATAVPIDPQLTEAEVKNILSDSGAKLVINKANADKILKTLEEAPKDFNFPKTEIEDTASILYTSGTTAVPKGVMLSHRNFSANFNSIYKLGICNENDNIISILPLHHSYPFMVTLLVPLLLGATVTYVKTLKPEEIMSAMRETRVTMFVGVPQIFNLFYKGICEKIKGLPLALRILKPLISIKVRKSFGKGLRFFASGGARLDPKVAGGLTGFGFKILEGYGLTETAPVAAFNPLRKQKFGSVGVAIPDVEIKLSNPDKNGIGEVLIKGPNVMEGYYKRPAETAEAIKDGWFYSGDLGYLDKERYLFLTGRSKEVIVLSNGKNIYPGEIEAHYKRSPFIKELCVLGILKEELTEELGAVIVPDIEYFKKTGEVNLREKIKWDIENFSKELPAYKRIMDFIVAKEDLPKTRLGKLKRYEVEGIYKKQFGKQGTGGRVQGTEEKDLEIINSEVGKKITEFIRGNRGIKRAIRADDHLELDLGIDSLGRVELAVGLEKRFNIDIPESEIAKVFTIKDAILKISEILLKKSQKSQAPPPVSDEAIWKVILKEGPKDKIKEKIDLSPSLFSKVAAFMMFKFLYMIFKLFFNLRVEGRENTPTKGPFILCPNHASYLDAFIVAASVPYSCAVNLFFLGFREYFVQPVIRNMIKLMRVVPVDPAAELVNAMQASGLIIRNGRPLCIFPEGQRSIDGAIGEFKKGIGILSKELDVALIPLYIDGAFRAWPRGQRFPRPAPIKIVFGRPLDVKYLLQFGRQKGAKDEYDAIAVALREEVLWLKNLLR